MALSEAAKEAIYLRNTLNEIDPEHVKTITLFSDNRGAIKLAENPIFHNRSKHIDVRHHFVREVLEKRYIEVIHKPSEDMAADIFTKGLSRSKHRRCLTLLGLLNEINES